MPDPSLPCDPGLLLACQLADADGASAHMLRELVTDLRLVGLEPVVFVAQHPRELRRHACGRAAPRGGLRSGSGRSANRRD
jgi:hypothetical protein